MTTRISREEHRARMEARDKDRKRRRRGFYQGQGKNLRLYKLLQDHPDIRPGKDWRRHKRPLGLQEATRRRWQRKDASLGDAA